MSDTVTFSSGVHVGARGSGSINQAWFSASPTTQFTTFTLTLAAVQALTSIEGRPGDREPIALTFQGGGLPAAYDLLKAMDARNVLNGGARMTLSGALDAVASSGFLAQVTLELEGDSSPRSEWGIVTQARNSVSGGMRGWTLSCVFVPCCLLWLAGTESVFAAPDCYAALPGDDEEMAM